MTTIGVRELRQNASRYLALVKAGQTVQVTQRGQLVALLTPADRSDSARDRLVAEGRLLPAERPSRGPLPLPPAPVPGEPTNAELLDAERADLG